jgi:hypothetical protein
MSGIQDKLIWTKKNALEKSFCKNVIDKFEKDPNKHEGMVGRQTVDTTLKVSTDLAISGFDNWKEYDSVFFKSLNIGLEEYKTYLKSINSEMLSNIFVSDSGYQIQKTIGGSGFYHWHHDYFFDPNLGSRFITFIWYLNDVIDCGETEFCSGDKIKPEQGKLLLFPATWNYIHRGISPSKGLIKYICTGWLHSNM